ncbi:DUF5994 family protein [Streptomyces chartreusis]|uniref:DUF5994 family protein n=1 Tax=Streptomyces chartreusis TaxID=1969 RepID=UPI003422AF45
MGGTVSRRFAPGGTTDEHADEMPTRMAVDDRVVDIAPFSVGDDTALVIRGDQDHFSLLVISPDKPPEAARAAMAEAVGADNPEQAVQILIRDSDVCARPGRGLGTQDGFSNIPWGLTRPMLLWFSQRAGGAAHQLAGYSPRRASVQHR